MRKFTSSFLLSFVENTTRFNIRAAKYSSAGINPAFNHKFQLSSHFCSFENSFSTIATAPFTTRKQNNLKQNLLQVEIISKQNIKPSSPTPDYLKNYQVSILDQLIPKNIYMPFVFFYPNNNILITTLKRRQLLKQSLSQTLTKFYPLAGKVQDDRNIDCNDEGVYYIEAKVPDNLSDFLHKPDNKSIHKLLPFDPSSLELLLKTYVVMIQVTVFNCGGIAIGLYTSHKIIDGYSLATFLKAWADNARGSSEQEICPSFIAPSIFLPIPTLPDVSTTETAMPIFQEQIKCLTKRFVFSSSSLITLKEKTGLSSTRVNAVTSLIWKCVIKASKKLRPSQSKSYIMMLPVNLRTRSIPPLPPYSIGNIIWCTVAQYQRVDDSDLRSIAGILRNATDKIDSNFVEKMKGKEGSRNMWGLLDEMKKCCNKDCEYIAMGSVCNGGIYEVDFGWGKAIWISVGNADADVSLVTNKVLLMDHMRCGDSNGIEAWVTLREEDMGVFESDPELLAFATLNPSPLEKVT